MPTTDTNALTHAPTGGLLALYDAACKALAEAKAVGAASGAREPGTRRGAG